MEPDSLLEVEISKISVNPYQPRRQFGKEELEELAESIKAVGILHPPSVKWVEESESFELIAGERRFRAAYLAGLKKVTVMVRKGDNYFSAEAALIENIQRVDLNPLEVARALEAMKRFGITQDDLAKRIGKKRSTISNYLRLLDLPLEIQHSLEQEQITMGHAKALLSLETEEEQQELLGKILQGKLNVREAEDFASAKISKKGKTPPLDVHLQEIAGKLQERLGTKVSIQGSVHEGKLTIDYYSLEDLERVIELIGT